MTTKYTREEIDAGARLASKVDDAAGREHFTTILVGLFKLADKKFDAEAFRRRVDGLRREYVPPSEQNDVLDIPAFLRRQAC
jgi:hypothetical protein